MFRITLFLTFFFVFLTAPIIAQNSTGVSAILVVETNISGGGFQSDVTITDDGQIVYSSGDVSGIFKSIDGGLSFVNVNEGLKSPKVASLAITPDNNDILYAGTGEKGSSGGLFRSIDGGDTWDETDDGDLAQFAGNHSSTSDPLPIGHPRSNGDLIVVDNGNQQNTFTDDIVIAGTYKDGVHIFTDGGDIEASSVNTSGFVRSLAYDPSIPNTVYAAIHFNDSGDNGIYEIDYSNPSSPTSTLVYQTPLPEGVAVLSSGHVYAAIGEDGIAKYNGSSWSTVNTGLSIGNNLRQWTAVTGYVKGNADVVYAGVNNLGGNQSGTDYSNIWRTKNGGSTWESLVDASTNVSDQILGQSYDWWFRTDAFPQAGLGLTNSVVSSIDVALGTFPQFVTDDIIYVSGRGGLWKSDDGGDNWNPAVYNMQATSNRGIAINPNDESQVAVANTDFVVLETSNRFENSNVSRDKPSGAESRAYDIIFDSVADEVIIGAGDRDNNQGGEVFIKSASDLGNPSDSGWTDTNLDALVNKRVRAITAGYHNGSSSTSQTIIAALEGEDVHRYHNGSWDDTGLNIGSTKGTNLLWPDNENSGVVYLLDLLKGLYRSQDGGQTWSNMWPSMSFNNNDFYNTGYLTADNDDPTTIYVSIQGKSGSPIGTSFKVYRMTEADTRVFGSPGSDGITDITFHSGSSSIKRPGPITFGPNGNLWLTEQQNSPNSIDAGIYVMENPTTDTSFKDLTTNAYRNIAIRPSGIEVSSDGYAYITQNGTGVVKLQYTSAANIGVSDTCIEIYPDPDDNLYTVSGDLSSYTIDIIDSNGSIYSNLDNTSAGLIIDTDELPAGYFLIRVSDPNNSQMCVEKIIKY